MNFFRQNQMFLIAAILTAAFLISCRKNAEDALALVSDAEATEIMENSVSGRSAGAAMTTEDMATLADDYFNLCGVSGDTTLQHSNAAGPATCSSTFNLTWLVNCNNLNVPQNAVITINGNGTFTTQRWAGNNATTGSLTFTGLNPQAVAYLVNGTLTLQGDITGKLRKIDPSLACTTTVTITDLAIRKSDHQITGGTGTVVIVATNGKGQSQTINGSLVFNGDGTATATVNGHTHTFSL